MLFGGMRSMSSPILQMITIVVGMLPWMVRIPQLFGLLISLMDSLMCLKRRI